MTYTRPMSFGHTLALARKAAGVQQRDLANQIGVSVSTLSTWERDITAPDANALRSLADILRVSADVLLERRPFEWPERAPGLSSAPLAAPAPVAAPAPAAAPRKAAPARRAAPAATVAQAATVATPAHEPAHEPEPARAPTVRPAPVSSAPDSPFAVQLARVPIPAASTSAPDAPPASAPLVRTNSPAAAPRTAPARQAAPVSSRAESWAEAFAAEQIAAWGPGKSAAWNVSTGATGVACPACGATTGPLRSAQRVACKCIERRRLWAAVRPMTSKRIFDWAKIENIYRAIPVDADLNAVSLALSAPGGEWRVIIGDDAGPAVPRAEVNHAIECGLVWLTQAQSGAPVWRLTDKGRHCASGAARVAHAFDSLIHHLLDKSCN